MQISSKFTIAVHTLLCISIFSDSTKVTSDFIASSVGVNSVIIRRTLQALKSAQLITVASGVGGAKLLKSPESITLYDIFKASGSEEINIFHFHEQPNPKCIVGKNIHIVLDPKLKDAQSAFNNSLNKSTLKDILDNLNEYR